MKYPMLTTLAAAAALHTSATFAEVQTDAIVRIADGETVGESRLERHVNRVTAVLRTSDLDPGAAMTVWWRVYNRPWHCAVPFECEFADLADPMVDGSQLHAAGFVADDAQGHAVVVTTLYRTAARAQGGGRLADSFEEGHLNGRGLRRPLDAEIELLLANHGRLADPEVVGEEAAVAQLTTPGATPVECADPEMDTAARTFRCGVVQRVDHAAP